MKQLVIIGARGFGREIYSLSRECVGYGCEYDVKGFLDDNADALQGLGEYPPILGPVETYIVQPDDVFVCALGDVKWKRHYTDIILGKGGSFQTLVHSTAVIGMHTRLSRGCVVSRYAVITVNVSIGAHTYVASFCNIGHDAQLGNYCHLGAYTFLGGYSIVEDACTLHPRSNILPKVRIGSNATVGAGSVVLRNVKEGDTVFGVPSRSIKL